MEADADEARLLLLVPVVTTMTMARLPLQVPRGREVEVGEDVVSERLR